jgi:hypothetical protein
MQLELKLMDGAFPWDNMHRLAEIGALAVVVLGEKGM